MPLPVTPNDFKALTGTLFSGFCGKFSAILRLPMLVYQMVNYMFNSAGEISDDFKADICGLGCLGGGTGGTEFPVNANMPAPVLISASDGSESDKVILLWSAVTPPAGVAAVSGYKIYRADGAVTDPTLATLIDTVAGNILTYDDLVDGDLVAGTIYNYWVRATNGAETSTFSNSNTGFAGTATSTLAAVTDLRCTKGFYQSVDGFVGLIWTPVAGATKWDIYRGTTNVYADAVVIAADQVPTPTTGYGSLGTKLWDNDGELLYTDDPPSGTAIYYYWVVAKKSSPPAVSTESNSDNGWVQTAFAPWEVGNLTIGRGEEWEVPSGITAVRVVLFSAGAGGAGAGYVHAGGGGGAGAVITGELTVVAGSKLRYVVAPDADDTGRAAAQTNGPDGSIATLEYSANGTWGDTVTLMTAAAPGGGVYSASGNGAGGTLGSGSTAGVTNPVVYDGHAGGAASSGVAGKSGYKFGSKRNPASNFGPSGFNGVNGSAGAGGAGTGSNAAPFGALADATGGAGAAGSALIAYG